MTLLQVYRRVIALLAPEKFLAISLALASVAIGLVQLAEPVLFGRVVDALSEGDAAFPIISLWAALGLFGIAAGAVVATFCGSIGPPHPPCRHEQRIRTRHGFADQLSH